MDRHQRSEYVILRRTVATRGALRPILVVIGLGIWAAILIAVLVWLPSPVAATIPLLILAVTFEAIRPLHFGAERIGRYIQVFYEEAGDPGRPLNDTPAWERVAMSLGSVPGVGGHPLFVPLFFIATAINFSLAGPLPELSGLEMSVIVVPHLAFFVWLIAADRAMRRQRTTELARFRELYAKKLNL
jgi:hypothetical protein